VQAEEGRCISCGKALPAGQTCVDCTVTDLNTSALVDLQSRPVKPADVFVVDKSNGQRHAVIGGKWKVGRDPNNHLCIAEDSYASRFHAWITCEDGHYFIEDLGSTNGTLVNGEPLIRRRPLVHGDHIRVGRTELTFQREPAAGSASLSPSNKQQTN
jgi:pSer/pThr/pTyr-binding forkhead associated (FHA) protein